MCKCIITVFIMSFMILSFGCAEKERADLVILGGKVITVDDDFSVAEAVAVTGGRIVRVGVNKDIESLIGPGTHVIRLSGETVLPGLIDSHAHLNSLGSELVTLQINDCGSYEEIISRVKEEVNNKEPGEWIVGGRWNHTRWENPEFPHHLELSRVSPNNPIFLTRVDGNSGLVNQKAMELAGIDRNTPDPSGGVIHKDSQGNPSGVLINQAMNLVKNIIPAESKEQYKAKLVKALDDCIAKGLTGVHEAGISPFEIDIYKELADQKGLKLRVYAMLGSQEEPVINQDLYEYFSKYRLENYGGNFFSVLSIKLFFDGALGSRGAAFYEGYQDDPENTGLLRIQPEYIYEVTKAALKAGMNVCTHCIGIRGNRLCLEAYEKALREVPKEDHRLRIEHAQIVEPVDIEKFAELKVIPAMQPTHCTSDMNMIDTRIGEERSRYSYAWRSFLEKGLVIPSGSDFPVESNNPLWGIYAAVTRQDHEGNPEEGWHPQELMTREEAIRGFTIWGAYAAFQEKNLGSIEPGKLADFTIIDKDILEDEPREIINARVVYTIVDGKIKFSR